MSTSADDRDAIERRKSEVENARARFARAFRPPATSTRLDGSDPPDVLAEGLIVALRDFALSREADATFLLACAGRSESVNSNLANWSCLARGHAAYLRSMADAIESQL